jgi:lysophospholipase L1-like esterase
MRKFLVSAIALISLLLMAKGSARPTNVDPHQEPVTGVAPVVFMGDSITMGAWVSSAENMFVNRVWQALQARGVKGPDENLWTSDAFTDLATAQKAAVRNRKLIVVEVGVHWEPVFDDAGFRKAYAAMLDCLQGSGAIVVVGTIPWLGWAPDSPTYAKMSRFSEIIREEAARRDIEVADLWAATDGREDAISRPDQPCFPSPTCRGDNYHPGDVGHALIAEAYVEALSRALANPPYREYEFRCSFDEYFRALANATPAPIMHP